MAPIRLTLIVLSWFAAISCYGQEQDTTTVPTVAPLVQKSKHSPRKALLYSAILPGLGQAYNRKIWKVPIVYAALGFSTYMIIDNRKNYNAVDKAYTYRFDNDPTTVDLQFARYSDEAIFRRRAVYDKNYQQAWLWAGIIYGLNLVDAFVDAHLMNFDVNDDLSLRLAPNTSNYGFTAMLSF